MRGRGEVWGEYLIDIWSVTQTATPCFTSYEILTKVLAFSDVHVLPTVFLLCFNALRLHSFTVAPQNCTRPNIHPLCRWPYLCVVATDSPRLTPIVVEVEILALIIKCVQRPLNRSVSVRIGAVCNVLTHLGHKQQNIHSVRHKQHGSHKAQSFHQQPRCMHRS